MFSQPEIATVGLTEAQARGTTSCRCRARRAR
ncbi:hypothetical protein OIV38_13500, partial [Burkholderia pseudomallei]|nr:hypothetical protein [Burkholderia pseudomallei]